MWMRCDRREMIIRVLIDVSRDDKLFVFMFQITSFD